MTTTTQIPGQPDGIADDSRDLPHPARAAERVRDYIAATGDGLYDVQDGQPLYGRDLEAIARAALGAETLWRCTKCGKWSHAKRRPSSHKRWVATGTATAAWAGDPFAGPAGEFRECGPFQAWSATPATGPIQPAPPRRHVDEPRLDRPVETVRVPALSA